MRWMNGILKMVLTAAITSICCIVLTFFTVKTYADFLLDQYHIQRPANQLDWNQFMNRLMAQFTANQQSAGTEPAEKDLAVSVSGNQPAITTETGSKDNNSNPPKPADTGKPNQEKKPPEDAVAVWSRQSGQGNGVGNTTSIDDKKVVVSSEEVTKRKEQMSEGNKAKVFSLLASRVPQAEIQKISQILEDGITAEELKELQQIVKTYLTPDEYKQLLDLIEAG